MTTRRTDIADVYLGESLTIRLQKSESLDKGGVDLSYVCDIQTESGLGQALKYGSKVTRQPTELLPAIQFSMSRRSPNDVQTP
jgi:hypothetical protein